MNRLLTEEALRLIYNDPIIQAVIELKSKRIASQQVNRLKGDKRRMNSFGRWSKMMRDKYKGEVK